MFKIALAPMAIGAYLRPQASNLAPLSDVKSALLRVKTLGYDGIDCATPSVFESPKAYKDYLDEIGLEATSCGGLTYDQLKAGDVGAKIEECHTLGSRNVMISNLPNEALGNEYELGVFIRALNRCGALLAAEDIHLSFHNHAVDLSRIGDTTVLKRIVDGTDVGSVFFELDTHWLTAGGAHVVSWISALAGRQYITHCKDYAIDVDSDTTFLESNHKIFAEVGQGNLNWPGILAACRDAGVTWLSVEQDVTRRPGYESCKLSIDYLRALDV